MMQNRWLFPALKAISEVTKSLTNIIIFGSQDLHVTFHLANLSLLLIIDVYSVGLGPYGPSLPYISP
jgi:hypothetical protein